MDKYLKEAYANVSVENNINPEVIETIKQVVEYAKDNNTSFLTSLYELVGKEKNERKKYNR